MAPYITLKLPHYGWYPFERIQRELDGYIQLQCVNGSWCVRRSTSEWDKERGKPRKISEHLGVITEGGIFKSKTPGNAISGTSRQIFEYGNGALAYHLVKDIESILD